MFDDILKKISYGLYVVTTMDENEKKAGCTINTCMQLTVEPATIVVSINSNHYTSKCIKHNKKFGVSIMAENTPLIVIGTFGYYSSIEKNKFAEIDYEVVDGIPVIKSSLGYLICEVINEIEEGTHTLYVGKIINAKMYRNEKSMTYADYHKLIGK